MQRYLGGDFGALEDHVREVQHSVPVLDELLRVPPEEPAAVVAVEVAAVAEETRVLRRAVVLAWRRKVWVKVNRSFPKQVNNDLCLARCPARRLY